MGRRVHVRLAARPRLRQRAKRRRPPQAAIPSALLFFNVGVEIGQLLFIASVFTVIVLARQVTRRIGVSQPAWAWRVPPDPIGTVAAFWIIERIAAF